MKSQKEFIYFDHNATTPVHGELLLQLSELASSWGNPSSIHLSGREPKNILRETRAKFSSLLNCSPLEIIFTSGGSESNNTVLKSLVNLKTEAKNKILVSQVEHPSLIKTAQYLETLGFEVAYIPVSKNGILDFDKYLALLDERTLLVSCMFANNETGSLFPIAEMVKAARKVGALFHSDCVQGLGKVTLDLKSLDVDYASFSFHKCYSLKGSGALYVKRNAPYGPLIHGGGQERHRRGGTENTLGIAAMSFILDRFESILTSTIKTEVLRNYLEEQIQSEISGVVITAVNSKRIPNTSHMTIDGIDGETLLMSLDLKGYAVSTGAACSSGSPEPSPVLLAMGFTKQEAQKSLRISLGISNTQEQVDQFILVLKEVVARLRMIQLEEDSKQEASHV